MKPGKTTGGSRRSSDSRGIPRRDFLQGTLLAAASTLTGVLRAAPQMTDSPWIEAQNEPGYYPPKLTGLRGSHVGSFEAAHAVRDGRKPENARDTGEVYDLVVVGAGISGLSAAHFYRSRRPKASRILILDNHDDFGGHAKRNEFLLQGRLQLLNGGTLEIESPRPYSRVAEGLIRELGIDVESLSKKVEDQDFYERRGLSSAVFFDRETFGRDHLATGEGKKPILQVLAQSPLSERARSDIQRVEEGSVDYLPEMSSAQKKVFLSQRSYRDFLLHTVKVEPEVATYYQARTHGWWGVGTDAVSALDCWAMEFPGFKGLNLEPGSIPHMGYSSAGFADTGGSKTLHFPDGNATIARLLVRRLIPGAVPGHTAEDIVTARIDYNKLDNNEAPVRLRLSSTAARVENASRGGSPGVAVTYIQAGQAYTVSARHCVLACWNMMIPFICPEIPDAQKQALRSLVKTPLVYTSVALRDWSAFSKLGVSRIYAPGCYHYSVHLNPKVDIGGYRSSKAPNEPMLVHMERTPCKPGLPEHEQNRAGRVELLSTPFATIEENIRDQLTRTLGAGGFDAARDIEAITVNRWPHGYSPEYNPLFDPDVPASQRPNVIGRARVGQIAIANSDAGAAAYTDAAIDQASRAVDELLG
jgi:spermidine dehydrogenase